jgi:hypothetical protein
MTEELPPPEEAIEIDSDDQFLKDFSEWIDHLPDEWNKQEFLVFWRKAARLNVIIDDYDPPKRDDILDCLCEIRSKLTTRTSGEEVEELLTPLSSFLGDVQKFIQPPKIKSELQHFKFLIFITFIVFCTDLIQLKWYN